MITVDHIPERSLHLYCAARAKEKWCYPLYVPSYNRAGTAPFLNRIAKCDDTLKSLTHIMVRPEQHAAYEEAYPWATLVPVHAPGVGPARMSGLVHARENDYSRVCMADDDLQELSLMYGVLHATQGWKTVRYSARRAGVTPQQMLKLTYATSCLMADNIMDQYPRVSYGSARNTLWCQNVSTLMGAEVNKGPFPSNLFYIDTERFTMEEVPKEFQYHGEDLAFILNELENDNQAFVATAWGYTQDSKIPSQIPLDPESPKGRNVDLESAEHLYPDLVQYLVVRYRNAHGGAKRIGIQWSKFCREQGESPIQIPLSDIV